MEIVCSKVGDLAYVVYRVFFISALVKNYVEDVLVYYARINVVYVLHFGLDLVIWYDYVVISNETFNVNYLVDGVNFNYNRCELVAEHHDLNLEESVGYGEGNPYALVVIVVVYVDSYTDFPFRVNKESITKSMVKMPNVPVGIVLSFNFNHVAVRLENVFSMDYAVEKVVLILVTKEHYHDFSYVVVMVLGSVAVKQNGLVGLYCLIYLHYTSIKIERKSFKLKSNNG